MASHVFSLFWPRPAAARRSDLIKKKVTTTSHLCCCCSRKFCASDQKFNFFPKKICTWQGCHSGLARNEDGGFVEFLLINQVEFINPWCHKLGPEFHLPRPMPYCAEAGMLSRQSWTAAAAAAHFPDCRHSIGDVTFVAFAAFLYFILDRELSDNIHVTCSTGLSRAALGGPVFYSDFTSTTMMR